MHQSALLSMVAVAVILPASAVGATQPGDAVVKLESSSPPARFAGEEIRQALRQAGWNVMDVPSREGLTVVLSEPDGKGTPESFEIIRTNGPKGMSVRVRGSDVRGLMYGGLDVAEQIASGAKSGEIVARQARAFLPVRAVKFNIPFSGNVYTSHEDQANSGWFFDLEYWRAFVRFLAYHRYNLLTFWNSHPYDRMVRLRKYPEANTLPVEEMDRNIAFFHKLFGMARDCGIDTSIVTWNIHTATGFQKAHNVKDGQDSPLVRDYQKECVRALLTEYPELTGIGTCPGEAMENTADWREDWIRDTYLSGIAASGRQNVPFIHRFWGSEPPAVTKMLGEAKYPGPVYLDIKFNGEHMYSSTSSHVQDQRWLTQNPKPYKLLWHLRNDCIFQLRWGDPEFAARVVRNCGGADSAGFVMGSEVEVPGLDRYHTPESVAHRTWKYEFEKNWMRFGVWGRAGYNPDEPRAYWVAQFNKRFGEEAGPAAFTAMQDASRIIPLTTSFHWNYMNGDWYPEANIGSWNTSAEVAFANYRDKKMWHDVLEWVFTHTIDKSLEGIPDYVADQLAGSQVPEGVLTPPMVAERLEAAANASAQARAEAGRKISDGKGEWECTSLDLRALELLGRYYAEKIRGATDLMFLLATGEEPRRAASIGHLEKALGYWKELASVTSMHYISHEVFLFDQFDWKRYTPEAQRDIKMVQEAVPWQRNEQTWKVGPEPLKVTSRWWSGGDHSPGGLQSWVGAFNRRFGADKAKPLGKHEGEVRAETTIPSERQGMAILSIRAEGTVSARVAGAEAKLAGADAHQFLVAPVEPGDNRVELTFARSVSVVPQVGLQTVLDKASMFVEAESGELVPPMAVKDISGNARGKVVWAPLNKGRGVGADGKIVDNGRGTYTLQLPRDGAYSIHACVWWGDASANSFLYAWDGDAPKILGNDETNLAWHWVQTEPAKLKSGLHKLTIRNREEGSMLDCFVVAFEPGAAAASPDSPAASPATRTVRHVRPGETWEMKDGRFYCNGRWVFLKSGKLLRSFEKEETALSVIADLDVLIDRLNYNSFSFNIYPDQFDGDADTWIDPAREKAYANFARILDRCWDRGVFCALSFETYNVGGGGTPAELFKRHPDMVAANALGEPARDVEYGENGKLIPSVFHPAYLQWSRGFIRNFLKGLGRQRTERLLYVETTVEP